MSKTEVMGFTAEDVVAVVEDTGREISLEDAEKFLAKHAEDFKDRLTEQGYETLLTFLDLYGGGDHERSY